MRATSAISRAESATVGMTSEVQPVKPKLGSQRHSTEDRMISISPSQKFGIASRHHREGNREIRPAALVHRGEHAGRDADQHRHRDRGEGERQGRRQPHEDAADSSP